MYLSPTRFYVVFLSFSFVACVVPLPISGFDLSTEVGVSGADECRHKCEHTIEGSGKTVGDKGLDEIPFLSQVINRI